MRSIPTEPLLRFALMSLEHAVEHYRQGKDADRAFFILHLDHAVELVLKERLRRGGQSITKKDGRTLSMGEALDGLGKCKVDVKERTDLELLHGFRNQLQHIGATLDSLQMEHYAATTFPFFRRFLREELGVDIESVLEQYVLEELARSTERDMKKRLLEGWKDVLNKVRSGKPELAQELESRRVSVWVRSDPPKLIIVSDNVYSTPDNLELLKDVIMQIVGLEFDVWLGTATL